MKTVVLFIPTLSAGGAERVASVLANEWCNYEGTRVRIITLFDDPVFYPLDPRVEFVCLAFRAHIGGLGRIIDLFRALLSLRRAIVALRPSFILSFMNKYNAFCVAALFGTGHQVIVSERDSPTEVLPWVRVLLRKLTYPLAAAVLVQSRAAQAFILENTRARRVAVLLNPVNRLIEQGEREPQQIILNVSRLHPKKGQADLLEAFALARAEGWTLSLCGDGPLRSALEQKARALGISERTHFFGTVTDLRPHFRSAGIFAFTSYWEGFPNALAEAMVAGIPCVSYDCPTGPSELIENGVNGILVPVGDVARLRQALTRVMADHALAAEMSQRATAVTALVELQSVSRLYWDTCLSAAEV